MFENVNKELLEKAMKAGSKEDALNILKQGGVELTEEDLQNISGGEGDGICWTHCFKDGEKCVSVCVLFCPKDDCPCL